MLILVHFVRRCIARDDVTEDATRVCHTVWCGVGGVTVSAGRGVFVSSPKEREKRETLYHADADDDAVSASAAAAACCYRNAANGEFIMARAETGRVFNLQVIRFPTSRLPMAFRFRMFWGLPAEATGGGRSSAAEHTEICFGS